MTVVGVALLASAGGALAADVTPNLYINADAGGIFQQNADFSERGRTETASFNPGLRADIAIGYKFSQSFALELEPGFMWNSVDSFNGYQLRPGESIDLYSIPILANVIYKFPVQGAWTPCVGVGVGANVGIFDGTLPGMNSNDTDITFAYQAQAGIKYALSDTASVGVAYKFLGTADQDYSLPIGPYRRDNVTFGGIYVHGIFATFTMTF